MNDRGPSLAGRAVLAVALTIGFYTLALLIAAALIAFPILGIVEESVPFNIWLAIFMVVSGLTILKAIFPRRQDRKSTRLNSSHANISYAVFCLKKNKAEYI